MDSIVPVIVDSSHVYDANSFILASIIRNKVLFEKFIKEQMSLCTSKLSYTEIDFSIFFTRVRFRYNIYISSCFVVLCCCCVDVLCKWMYYYYTLSYTLESITDQYGRTYKCTGKVTSHHQNKRVRQGQ